MRTRVTNKKRPNCAITIGADFAGAIAPQSKFCGGDAPAVTREVAPVNHGAKPRESRGKAPVIHGAMPAMMKNVYLLSNAE